MIKGRQSDSMLKLYAGRENIDKERFIYEHVQGETLIIVPNQYTLVAEERALEIMGTDCLFDVEILSMNRLGLRVLTEQGLESVPMLDRYGRLMLLTKLVKEHAGDFDIFRRSAGKLTFTSMLSDFISEFKQHNCTLAQVSEMLEGSDADPLLRAKLKELSGVIGAYEEAVRGKYTDSEDYVSMYIDAIGNSELVRRKSIWIYGYDSITPKFTDAMLSLAETAKEVNFIVNRSDFELDRKMTAMLTARCADAGIPVTCAEIGPEYAVTRSETVARIERSLWSNDFAPEVGDDSGFDPEDLTITCAANPYYEAESAAAYIWHLIRDLGYRMRDIQVIANDEAAMHPVIRRVFAEYGLPVFMDSSRNITDTPAVGFIVFLLWFVVHSQNPQYLFSMLKTGLAGVSEEDIETLENYARTYHIRGTMWDREFRYGEDNLGSEAFEELNGLRAGIMDKISPLKEMIRGDRTVREFADGFREYLGSVWQLDEKIASASAEEEALGFGDEAQRNTESYAKSLEMLGQIVEIMGDSQLDIAEFTELYVAGLTSVEVGVIPPAVDGLSVGTMIRTRPRPVRAAVILGANEGTLPMQPSPEGLFSVDEKQYFRQKGFALGSLDDLKINEENTAMYRMLSRPSDKLYISCSLTDASGNDILPSPLIDSLKTLFPVLKKPGRIRKDIVSTGWPSAAEGVISTGDETLRHLVNHLKDRNSDGSDSLTRALLRWYRDNRPEELSRILRAAADENIQKPLGAEVALSLFGRKRSGQDGERDLVLSASSISSYFDCPFRYYIDRGLKPREEREFSSDPRSIGDAYHECLMRIARIVISDRDLLTQAAEDDEVLARLVDSELEKISQDYEGGLFISAGSEEFRMSRIREICFGAARSMAQQLSAPSVEDAVFEESFSRSGRFAPVTMDVDGKKVYVEGKIDRSDILSVDGSGRVRIIDYKTGSDSLNLWKMRHGYKMQLMIYMISAASGGYEPAGMFYFNIKDPIESLDSKSDSKAREIMDRDPADVYKLKGRYISEPGVLNAMPESVLGGSRERSMTRAEYEEARNDVLARIEETAEGILRGSIDISPFKDSKGLACARCSYKSICRRDREYRGPAPRSIPPEPKKEKKSDGN